MLVCDRCGTKIVDAKVSNKKVFTIYNREACYIGHYVDLCPECLREYDKFTQKAESYFMVNKESPIKIFDGVKYWSD